MKVKEVVAALDLTVRSGAAKLERDITGAYVSDLLSDVMSNAREGNVWITLQIHPNIVAVASLLNLAAVIVSRGAEPEEATITKAEEEGIVLLTSREPSFEVAGRLYRLLHKG
ncbi:MAG TPA: serine kinase [Syntrophomonadaceae bacterium]|nr:serine kinase [Syntrophomonadaceae bacterium]